MEIKGGETIVCSSIDLHRLSSVGTRLLDRLSCGALSFERLSQGESAIWMVGLHVG